MIDLNDIIYFQAENKNIYVVTRNGYTKENTSLTKIEEKLPKEQFFRIHRTCIVNLSYIKSFTKERLLLDTGVELPISRRRFTAFEKAFSKNLSKANK